MGRRLAAAASTFGGRVEVEAALRDAVLLARPGDFLSVGPAGLLLLAWRRLAARPGDELLMEKNLAAVLEEFGYGPDDEGVSDLADDLRQLAAGAGMVARLTGTSWPPSATALGAQLELGSPMPCSRSG